MKYKVLRSFLWLKEGEIVETKKSISGYELLYFTNVHTGNEHSNLELHPHFFPTYFAPISEEEEKEEECIKYLEGKGYEISKWKITSWGATNTAEYKQSNGSMEILCSPY